MELASVLNKQQGEVSKIERRQDVLMSTMSSYVKSLGGKLEILARLPGGVVRALAIEEGQEPANGTSVAKPS